MLVPVEMIARLVFIDELDKRFKPFVEAVVPVAKTGGRRMGYEHVKPFFERERKRRLEYAQVHIPLGILVRRIVRALAAAETNKTHALDDNGLFFEIDAALRRVLLISRVVIAAHIQQRRRNHGHKEREVFRLEIAAGNHDVYAGKGFCVKIIPDVFAFMIGEDEGF